MVPPNNKGGGLNDIDIYAPRTAHRAPRTAHPKNPADASSRRR